MLRLRGNRKDAKVLALALTVFAGLGIAVGVKSIWGATPPTPQVRGGVLNLSQWALGRNGPIPLNGEWEFYWSHLLSPRDLQHPPASLHPDLLVVPGLWKVHATRAGVRLPGTGYATYRLHLIGLPAGQKLGLHLLTLGTAYRLWVNGNLLATNGTVSTSKRSSAPEYRPVTVFFSPHERTAEIVIQVSNFAHAQGGFWDPVTLGTAAQMDGYGIGMEPLLNIFLLCYLIAMGLYHLGLFAFRRHEPAPLFLGLLCLLIAARTGLTGEMPLVQAFPALGWGTHVAMLRLTVYLSPTLLAAFIYRLYPNEVSGKVVGLWGLLTIPFVASVACLPPLLFTSLAPLWEIILVPGLMWLMLAVAMALLHHREGAPLFFVGTVAVVLASFNDLLSGDTFVRTPLLIDLGVLVFTVCESIVLSMRLATADRIAQERQQLQGLIGNLPCGVVLVGVNDALLYHNRAAEQLLGRGLGDIPTAQAGFEMLFPDATYRHRIAARWDRLRAQAKPVRDRIVKVVSSDGQVGYLNVSLAFKDDGGVIVGFVDTTEQVRDREWVQHQANHDYLTGLPNVRLLRERLATGLAQAQRRGGMLAVLFLDLDKFKSINDVHGHQAGDQLLQEVAERLRGALRTGDTVGRIGGDEFCVLLPQIAAPADAAAAAERILAALTPPCTIQGRSLRIHPSIGISIHPWDGADPTELMNKADSAMYKAKREESRGYGFFSERPTAAVATTSAGSGSSQAAAR